jgi:hypothetical protein
MRWNTTGNFAVPTNYAIFAGLKKELPDAGPQADCAGSKKLENLNTVNTDVVL